MSLKKNAIEKGGIKPEVEIPGSTPKSTPVFGGNLLDLLIRQQPMSSEIR